MNSIKINPLYTFDFYHYAQEDKELVQEVFRNILSFFDSRPLIQWVSVKGGEVLSKSKVEITYYENKERVQEEVPFAFSEEKLVKAFELLNKVSAKGAEFLDAGERYSLMKSGSEKYFEFTVFDQNFMNADRLIETGFLSEELLDYLSLSVLEQKNIIVLGSLFSGRTTLLEILSSFIQEQLILIFENNREIKNEKNTVIRIRYDEISKTSEKDKHMFQLNGMNPDLVIYDNPSYALIEQPIEPYIMSYIKDTNWRERSSLPSGFKYSGDIFIETADAGNGKFRVEAVFEKNHMNDTYLPIFRYSEKEDQLVKQ